MNTKSKIIDLFARERNSEHTILQIAKAIEKSYAHVNKECRELISLNILNKKIVGNAILCSLNFSNDMTFGYLILNSTIKKNEFLKDNQIINDSAIEISKNPNIECIYQEENITYIVTNSKNEILINNLVNDYKIIDKQNLTKINDFSKIIILSGFENFWRISHES